jgi:hypothetical protein
MRALSLAAAAVALSLVLGQGAPARADVAALRARLAALGALSESEVDLGAQASRALERAEADRARGDAVAADRAEHVADAAIDLVERRRGRRDAEAALAARQAERDATRARLEEARRAASADAREHERLAPPEPVP